MHGYSDASYGDGFADVYDEWYEGISDIATTTTALQQLAGGGRVLELGVGTGRLAIPLAERGVEVHGLDSSVKMLERMAAKPGGDRVVAHLGDMVTAMPTGPFRLVFVAYNTFFNLLTAQRQQQCFHEAAARLDEQGCFVVEAFVPDPEHDPAAAVTVRSVTADRVVLSVTSADPSAQSAMGQYVDITEAGGVRLRPWAIRWATVGQLDEMAAAAGLVAAQRWETFAGEPFGTQSARHVTVFRRPEGGDFTPVRPSPGARS